MPAPINTSHHARLHILTTEEIRNVFYLPEFTDEEKLLYFSLTEAEFEILSEARSLPSKLNFILQLGYFKSRRLFFNFQWSGVRADAEFVCRRYFPDDFSEIQNLPVLAINTWLKHRRRIVELFGYRFCDAKERADITQIAARSARISAKPIYVFREVLSFLEAQKIILPGYSFLQDIVSSALRTETERLQRSLQDKLTEIDLQRLDNLIAEDAVGIYEITNLKREPRDFTLNEIRRETARGSKMKELYRVAAQILPSLEISNHSISYYASLVAYYRPDKLKRFDSWTTRLYLLCFISHRVQKLNDILINCLITRVRQYLDKAKEFAISRISAFSLTTNQVLGRAVEALKLLVDENIPAETPFGVIREQAGSILSPGDINQLAENLRLNSGLDETEFRWEYLDQIQSQFKLNLRPLLMNLDFTGVAETSDLLAAASFLRRALEREQILSQFNERRFPLAFIPAKSRRYFYRADPKSGKKQLLIHRYEFFVYQSLVNALEAGDVSCRESLKFRSFDDDLIDDKTFRQNKESLIETSRLPILAAPIEEHLRELETRLETRLKQVNERIGSEQNESFQASPKGVRWSLKYPSPLAPPQADSVFDSIKPIELYQLINFVNEQTDFFAAFTHLRGKYVKNSLDEAVIAAALMAWGTNTGLGKMSKISDLTANALHTVSDNFLRPETLWEANRIIVDKIAEGESFSRFELGGKTHSSSDGQKFETRFQTINSRYSPKYFGLKKGVVAYTLVANHIPVNARIIGANEHESHFVFDVLFNNSTKIQPAVHSTDSHGSNQINFALLHLFGYHFAPRFKDLYETVTKSLYGFEHPTRYADYQIKPIRKINQKLIVQEWDNLVRIILSLANKTTTQHIITRKLSSYARTNRIKQALWEYDNIIRSLYLLDYIDSPPLRQNVQHALNRGENYHQLKRAVAFANFGKLRFKSEYEQNIWNESARLLTNCILYYNLKILSELIKEKERNEEFGEVAMLKEISPTAWQHINFAGRYEFNQPHKAVDIAEIVRELSLISAAKAKIAY